MEIYEHLIQAFNLTLAPKSGEDIKQAEQYLEKVIFNLGEIIVLFKAKVQPKFLISLMMIIDNKDVI